MMNLGRRSVHVSVMPREVLQWLQLRSGLTVIDGTVGAAGHSTQILKHLGSEGILFGFDRDPMMIEFAGAQVKSLSESSSIGTFHLINSSYVDAPKALAEFGITKVDRVLLDLGLSSDQLADRERGFGFDAGGPLDMRFSKNSGKPASELLATLDEASLEHIFRTWGEEPAASRVASTIVQRRARKEFVETAEQLEACVHESLGITKADGGKNPATRVFQALRIAVNEELWHVEHMMTDVLPQIMAPGGIVVVISFHSLEDRIVKCAFKGHQGWQVLTKTPVEASPAEVRLNPRSRSAKLRAARWQGN